MRSEAAFAPGHIFGGRLLTLRSLHLASGLSVLVALAVPIDTCAFADTPEDNLPPPSLYASHRSASPHVPAGPRSSQWAAQEPLSPGLSAAGPSLSEVSVEELLRRLEERDALVERLGKSLEERNAAYQQLEQRVEELERQVGGPPSPATGREASREAVPSAGVDIGDTQAPSAAAVVESEGQARSATEQEGAALAPGEVEVDPDAAERALERTLVLTGDLLLPVGKIDVEPFLSYEFNDSSNLPASVLVTPGGGLIATNRRVKRDIAAAGINLRIGLPFDSQFEVGLPYKYVRRQENQDLSSQVNDDSSGSGIGDLRVGAAKTLLREDGWQPDLVARVTWDSRTGKDTDNGVSINSDFDEITGSISAIKRQDPFAFVGRLSYEHAFENNDFQPGDRFGLGASAVLAASPETSLRLSFNASYRDRLEFDGNKLDGTDENVATLSFGVSSILARGTLLNFNVGAGLTDDSPDYTVLLSLPLRMTLW